jgi:hypothetical protein
LCGRRPFRLKVPCLVKYGMVAGLDNAARRIEVEDVLVSGCVPKENASVIVSIKLAAAISRLPDTDS